MTSVVAGLVDRWARVGATGGTPVARILAHVRMLRPVTRLWLDTLLPLAALAATADGPPPARQAVLVVLAVNLIHGAAHILNDLQDVEVDRRSSEPIRHNRPIACGVIGPRLAVREAVGLTAAGLVPAFLLSPLFGALAAVVAAVVVLHELPPVRVQSRPVVAQVYTAVGFAVFLPLVAAAVPRPHWSAAVPFLLFLAVYMGWCETLVKDVRDVDNDAAGGKVTTPVRYGAARATAVASVGYAVAAGAWLWFTFTHGHRWPLLVAAAAQLLWCGFVCVAARRLTRTVAKRLCIGLHQGSIAVVTVANLAVLVTLW